MGVYRRHDKKTRGKVWWISYVAGGRQHRESLGSTNKKIAEKLLVVRKTQVFEERWNLPRSNAPRLEDYISLFINTVPHESTRARYRYSIKNLLGYFGAKIRLSEITPERIFGFQQTRLAAGVGKATVNRDIATLSSMLSKAKRLRFISHNPCADVGKLNERRDRRQARPLSYDEEAQIARFVAPWLKMLITLLVLRAMGTKR
jgi:Phage integrase, N-terminal SAM-like domain